MKEIEYEVTRNSSVDGDELDRYAVYRLLLLSFEKDVRSGAMEFDELIDIEKVAADTDRDNFMSADEAAEYGIIDKVIKDR